MCRHRSYPILAFLTRAGGRGGQPPAWILLQDDLFDLLAHVGSPGAVHDVALDACGLCVSVLGLAPRVEDLIVHRLHSYPQQRL